MSLRDVLDDFTVPELASALYYASQPMGGLKSDQVDRLMSLRLPMVELFALFRVGALELVCRCHGFKSGRKADMIDDLCSAAHRTPSETPRYDRVRSVRWTDFQKIAQGRTWSPEGISSHAPACYELAVGGPRGGEMLVMYVGETENEYKRICSYARDGSHLHLEINRVLRDGRALYYRAKTMPSKALAKEMQDRLLRDFGYQYSWNIVGNAKWRTAA